MQVDGCPLLNYDFAIENGELDIFGVWNPLFDCDSIRLYITGDANPRDGVSVIDLVRVLKHLLGIQPFTTILQYIAADANGSYTLSALDLVEIRKVILGQYLNWPSNHVLRFFHKTTDLPPPPGAILASKAAIPWQPGIYTIEFWAVKTGDIR
jgi:hypothetical protein